MLLNGVSRCFLCLFFKSFVSFFLVASSALVFGGRAARGTKEREREKEEAEVELCFFAAAVVGNQNLPESNTNYSRFLALRILGVTAAVTSTRARVEENRRRGSC